MTECVISKPQVQRTQYGIVCQPAQGDDDRGIRQPVQFSAQIAVAGRDLLEHWFVLRRQTFNGIGDPATAQFQAVVARHRYGFVAVAEFIQRFVQQDAGIVTGKRAPGGIGAMHAGCQPDDQQAHAPCGRFFRSLNRKTFMVFSIGDAVRVKIRVALR